jgi:hypothetical protein
MERTIKDAYASVLLFDNKVRIRGTKTLILKTRDRVKGSGVITSQFYLN